MFETRRQHPVAAITKVLEIIRENFITILIILFVGGGGDQQALINLTWLFGTIIVLLVWGILSWMRFTYRVEEDQLVIEQGVVMRKKTYISKNRIQIIDISSGIVQRIFGLVQVEVKTAGTSSQGAKISAVSREVANRLRETLRKEEVAEEDQPIVDEPKQPEIYRLQGKDLFIAATTSGRFGVALSIVGTAFSQIDQVFTEEQMIRYIQSVIPSSASTSFIVSSIVLILVVSWVFSFIGTVVRYAGFSIKLNDEELVISRGMFERKQLTIPYNRIQAIQIKEELLRQPFGYVTLKLDSAGYGDEGGKSVVLMPILERGRVSTFLEKVVPEYSDRTMAEQPPAKSLRRYLTRMLLLSIPVIILIGILFEATLLPLVLIVPALMLGYGQYLDAAVGTAGDTMILRYRLLSRNTVVLKKHRIQTVQRSFNPLQRRAGLQHLSVTVASGREGHQFTVRDLKQETAGHYWEWCSEHYDLVDGQKEELQEPEPNTRIRVLPAF